MNHAADWHSADSLPKHDSTDWAIRKGRKTKLASLEYIASAVQRWHPLQPILVGVPNSHTYVPPSEVAELDSAVRSFQKRSTLSLLMLLLGSIVLFVLWFESQNHRAAPVYIPLSMLTLIVGVDYVAFLRHRSILSERARFYYWLQQSSLPRVAFATWTVVAVAMGALQLMLQAQYGNLENAVSHYGAVYTSIRGGEYWRLITGPFYHLDLAHYLNNAFSMAFIGVFAWIACGPMCLAAFLIGNVVAAFAQMQLGTGTFDTYLGVSGGVFSLYGLVAAIGFGKKQPFPQGFTLICILIGLSSAVGAELLLKSAASVAHVAGAIVGIVFGLIFDTISAVARHGSVQAIGK